MDDLAALVQQALRADPFAGEVFVFRPKRADRVKILVYDGTGLVLYSKRLEAGRFTWPSPAEGVLHPLALAQPAVLQDGGGREGAVDVHADDPHPHLPWQEFAGSRRATRQLRIRARGAPGRVEGAAR